jgi:hypothetical protein
MAYQYVRYVYYYSQTGTPYTPVGMVAPYTAPEEARYRATHMVKVLTFARDQLPGLGPQNPIGGLKEADILKVFVAPEFFFRSSNGQQDGTGHYTMFEALTARDIVRRAVLFDSEFNDWLVVPGTVIYCQSLANKAQTPVIFNEAWAFARSTATTPKVDLTCQKQYFSDIDDLDSGLAPMTFGGALSTLVDYVDHQVFTVGGRTVGLEVCLDHRRRSLKNTVTTLGSPVPNGVDLHLLPACGMETIPGSVAARTNGYFLRCNGNGHALPPYQMFRVGAWPGGAPTPAATPPLADLAANLHTQVLAGPLQIYGWQDEIGYSDVLPL